MTAIAQRRAVARALGRGPTTRARSRAIGDYLDARLHLAALSMVAGAIHAVVAAPHLAEFWLFGSLFVALAVFQLGWGALLYRRPSPELLRIGAWVSAGVIAVWLASRTVGLPVGPGAGRAEAVGAVDAIATAIEAAIVGLCVVLLNPARRLPAPIAVVRTAAIGLMMAGLLALLLGGGHSH